MLNNGAIKNRTLFAHDNLDILRGIDSDCVDLIYLDPPFNKKKIFTAPTGSDAEGASFSDIFREEDVKEDWLLDIKEDHFAIHNLLSSVRVIEGRGSYNFCYLAYMGDSPDGMPTDFETHGVNLPALRPDYVAPFETAFGLYFRGKEFS